MTSRTFESTPADEWTFGETAQRFRDHCLREARSPNPLPATSDSDREATVEAVDAQPGHALIALLFQEVIALARRAGAQKADSVVLKFVALETDQSSVGLGEVHELRKPLK